MICTSSAKSTLLSSTIAIFIICNSSPPKGGDCICRLSSAFFRQNGQPECAYQLRKMCSVISKPFLLFCLIVSCRFAAYSKKDIRNPLSKNRLFIFDSPSCISYTIPYFSLKWRMCLKKMSFCTFFLIQNIRSYPDKSILQQIRIAYIQKTSADLSRFRSAEVSSLYITRFFHLSVNTRFAFCQCFSFSLSHPVAVLVLVWYKKS